MRCVLYGGMVELIGISLRSIVLVKEGHICITASLHHGSVLRHLFASQHLIHLGVGRGNYISSSSKRF